VLDGVYEHEGCNVENVTIDLSSVKR
jgi:hypothetical protein